MLMLQKNELKLEVYRTPCPKGATIGPPGAEIESEEDDCSGTSDAEICRQEMGPGSGSPTGVWSGGW